jgi:hypothetical protein
MIATQEFLASVKFRVFDSKPKTSTSKSRTMYCRTLLVILTSFLCFASLSFQAEAQSFTFTHLAYDLAQEADSTLWKDIYSISIRNGPHPKVLDLLSCHHCATLPFKELDLARHTRCFREACAVLIAHDHEITCSSTSQSNENIVKPTENFQILES